MEIGIGRQHRVPIGPLSILLMLAGCNGTKSDAARSGSEADRVAVVASRDSEASPSSAEYRDSAGFFDPDGYYVPVGGATLDGHELSWLMLHTNDVYYDGSLHYDRPRLVQPPEVFVALSPVGQDKGDRYPCSAKQISPDSLSVQCLGTPAGDVSIDGHFLDMTGKYGNTLAYEQQATVLLVARVVLKRDGAVLYDQMVQFQFTSGD